MTNRTRGTARWVALAVVAGLATAAVVPMMVLEAARALGAEAGTNPVRALVRLTGSLERLARAPAPDSTEVVYLGDSTVSLYRRGRQLPRRLQKELDAAAPGGFRVTPISNPGMGVFEFSLLSNVVAQGKPDWVIWQVSLSHFAEPWRSLARPEAVGWMPLSRLGSLFRYAPEARGLTLDRTLLYRGLVGGGATGTWLEAGDHLLTVAALPETFAGQLQGEAPAYAAIRRAKRAQARVQRSPPDRPDRLDADPLREQLGEGLTGLPPDHPDLIALSDGIEILRAAGTEVLVYLAPVNVEYLAAIGVLDPSGLQRSIAAIRTRTKEAGAHFVDFHDVLGDVAFKDSSGHLLDRGDVDGPAPIVAGLARALLARETEAVPR